MDVSYFDAHGHAPLRVALLPAAVEHPAYRTGGQRADHAVARDRPQALPG
ncbi:hypothetical protein [Streptomyces sp. NPDC002403]